jgi:LmbE family N-acetylglucosaminyl deacetylase
MSAIIFLSPHLDDAVFSCPAKILDEVQTGARVIVATIFSRCGSNRQSRALYARRRSEDKKAVRSLGARECWLGFPDAPFRQSSYNSFRRIIFESAPEDTGYAEEIAKVLDNLCNQLRPVKVYCPLGIGTHIDHRITFDAVSLLRTRVPIVYYEDRPYAIVRYAVRLRLTNLGAELSGPRQADFENIPEPSLISSFLRSFHRAPYVKRHLHDGEQSICNTLLRDQFRHPRPKGELRVRPAVSMPIHSFRKHIEKAVFSYTSQTELFLATPIEFFQNVTRYSRFLRVNTAYVERFWHPVKSNTKS